MAKTTDKAIAEYFGVTPQTLTNWKKDPKSKSKYLAFKEHYNRLNPDLTKINKLLDEYEYLKSDSGKYYTPRSDYLGFYKDFVKDPIRFMEEGLETCEDMDDDFIVVLKEKGSIEDKAYSYVENVLELLNGKTVWRA